MMNKRCTCFIVSFLLLCFQLLPVHAAILGPAETISDLRDMIEEASSGDTLLVTGEISMDNGHPLTIPSPIRIVSQEGEIATLRGLRLSDASVTFSSIRIEDSLFVKGVSNLNLSNSVRVLGSDHHSALSFSGNGTLIIEPGCSISGSNGFEGVVINHTGGEFYGSIEGSVRGGAGDAGGAGVVISPLLNSGALLISGNIEGGKGNSLGGHALNLYGLEGNAFITVTGSLLGGSGFIGGNGIQLISVNDNVSIGINGTVKGGSGHSHGGSGLIMMNVNDSSSFHLSGSFSGGDAIGVAAQPGTSLQLVGNSAIVRTRIDNCLLEDGHFLNSTPEPSAAPEPINTPTASPLPTPPLSIIPSITPLPEITAPADAVAYIIPPELLNEIQPETSSL